MPLLDIWKNTPLSVLNMNIQQILSMAGDGRLRDGSECATELREFFSEVDRETLKSYADYCLENSFEFSGFVLQDIINEVGRRFGFDVAHGLFRGRQNRNNADGLWCGVDWAFIVEVKTTDAYTIDLDRIADYQTAYSTTEEALPNSCLIVVGRQDTATLEDQVRGSRHNWEMRIVGVEALFEALALKELSEDKTLGAKLIDLLKPREFTRVDQILSAAFDFTTDRGQAVENTLEGSEITPIVAEPQAGFMSNEGELSEKKRTIQSDRKSIEQLKVKIASQLKEKFNVNLIRQRSLFQSQPAGISFVIAVSKPYNQKDKYWFSCHSRQLNFLSKAKKGFFVLAWLDTQQAFSVPVSMMKTLSQGMLVTIPKGDFKKKYFNVVIRQNDGKLFIYTHADHGEHDITSYEI